MAGALLQAFVDLTTAKLPLNVTQFHIEWPYPPNYTNSAPASMDYGGFWWYDTNLVPIGHRSILDDAAREGKELSRRLMAPTNSQNTDRHRVLALHPLAVTMLELVIDKDYHPTIRAWIQRRWDFVTSCIVKFSSAETAYWPGSFNPLEDLPRVMRFLATFERAVDGENTKDRAVEDWSLIRDLANKSAFRNWIEPILRASLPRNHAECDPSASSGTSLVLEEYSILGIHSETANRIVGVRDGMVRPKTPQEVEDLLPGLKISDGGEMSRDGRTYWQKKKELGSKFSMELMLREADEVEAEKLKLLQRLHRLLQHYVALYTQLQSWWDEENGKEYPLWRGAATTIDLNDRRCQVVQRAAWFLILGTESLWKKCEFYQWVGNFDEQQASSLLPKLKKWMLDMLVVAVSVQIDGWRRMMASS